MFTKKFTIVRCTLLYCSDESLFPVVVLLHICQRIANNIPLVWYSAVKGRGRLNIKQESWRSTWSKQTNLTQGNGISRNSRFTKQLLLLLIPFHFCLSCSSKTLCNRCRLTQQFKALRMWSTNHKVVVCHCSLRVPI